MKQKPLTLSDKVMLRDILKVILGDSDLRKGFWQAAIISTPEMKRLFKKLDKSIDDEIDAIPKEVFGGRL